MALDKTDLRKLAGETLTWCADKGCIRDENDDHSYFSVADWCDYFDYSPYIFGKVKNVMLELSILIALRARHGHYISDVPHEAASSLINQLKNIATRLETIAAQMDSVKKSKHYEDVISRLKESIEQLDIDFDEQAGTLGFSSKFLSDGNEEK